MASSILLPTSPSLLVGRNIPFIHRDLSWLQFNDRVLSEARSTSNPLVERLKFLAVTATNLDEFFMIRIPAVNKALSSQKKGDPKLQAHLSQIRVNLLDATLKFLKRQDETLHSIIKELEQRKILILQPPYEKTEFLQEAKKIFDELIVPHLKSPESFGRAPILALENLQLGAALGDKLWISISKTLPPVFLYEDKAQESIRVYFLDELLRSFLPGVFGVLSCSIIRMTRDGDFSIDLKDEDTESIPDVIQSGLGTREKGRPTRIQHHGSTPTAFIHKIVHLLKISEKQAQPSPKTFLLNGLWELVRKLSADPKYADIRLPSHKPFIPKPFLKKASIFDRLSSKDYLLHHPYDGFQAYNTWIQAACADPDVQMIEQTIYRTDSLSPLVQSLKEAAKKKKIRVLIELRARFDERNNLKLAEELRNAGAEVAFGFGKLKLHAKVALVSRMESGNLRHYTHLSTGNYNSTTAQIYTDLGLLTSNPDFGRDARHFFDSVLTGGIPTQFKELVSAPTRLHKKLLSLIDQEIESAKANRPARIVAKMNALIDEGTISRLYEASQAGVSVDLIVRGACSLIPGVKGLSENIRVISLIDRHLEHSRIYYFASSGSLYLSSADWMPRNFFSRLEIAFPILDKRIYQFIEQIVIPTYLMDTTKARELSAQGTWKKRTNIRLENWPISDLLKQKKSIRAQFLFEELANDGYLGTSLTQEAKH